MRKEILKLCSERRIIESQRNKVTQETENKVNMKKLSIRCK
jgi:hypothetical protein